METAEHHARTPFTSDLTLIQDIITKNEDIGEHLAVKEWLEQTCGPFASVEPKKDHYKSTYRQAHSTSGIRVPMSDRLIQNFHPDACTHEKRFLNNEDHHFEQALNKSIFAYLRRGDVASAADLCADSHEMWKSAGLRGGLYYQDPYLGNCIFLIHP
jgi:hypothetical protein